MKPNFVPLISSARTHPPLEATSRINLAPSRNSETPFRSLSEDLLSPCLPVCLPGEPQVTLERDGERVTRITVRCPCGHSVELTCEY